MFRWKYPGKKYVYATQSFSEKATQWGSWDFPGILEGGRAVCWRMLIDGHISSNY